MSSVINDYLEALERLKRNKTQIVEKGTVINKDTVALEAGRGRGSIKKSRAIFTDLIDAIEAERNRQDNKRNNPKKRIRKLTSDASKFKKLYEQSLARELSLMREVSQLKAENIKLKNTSLMLAKQIS